MRADCPSLHCGIASAIQNKQTVGIISALDELHDLADCVAPWVLVGHLPRFGAKAMKIESVKTDLLRALTSSSTPKPSLSQLIRKTFTSTYPLQWRFWSWSPEQRGRVGLVS